MIKVLMIGPAKADSSNYGMGVASAEIAHFLASHAELTIVSPAHAKDLDTTVKKERLQIAIHDQLTNHKVMDAEAVHIQVASSLPTYVYSDQKVSPAKAAQDPTESVDLKQELASFSERVVEAIEMPFDVLYAHDWLSIQAALELKKTYKKPLVLQIHSLDYDRTGKNSNSWIYALEKEGMQQADKVIAVSQYHADIMVEHYDIEQEKINVVPLGLATTEEIAYTSPFKEKIILFSGRLSHQKGIFKFIEIAELLLETEKDLRFIISGAGELSQEVVSRVTEKGLAHYFNFTGRISQEELHSLMTQSEAFIMPSISEPFGLVALEAASKALPIVMTKNAGANQTLKFSFIPKDESAAAYVKQIKTVLSNKEKVAEAVRKNQLAAESRNWEHVGKEILQILKD